MSAYEWEHRAKRLGQELAQRDATRMERERELRTALERLYAWSTGDPREDFAEVERLVLRALGRRRSRRKSR